MPAATMNGRPLRSPMTSARALPSGARWMRAAATIIASSGAGWRRCDRSRPARVRFVTALPKTRSGKLLRRAIQAVCEQRDPGDLTTIEDPSALQQIKDLVTRR